MSTRHETEYERLSRLYPPGTKVLVGDAYIVRTGTFISGAITATVVAVGTGPYPVLVEVDGQAVRARSCEVTSLPSTLSPADVYAWLTKDEVI